MAHKNIYGHLDLRGDKYFSINTHCLNKKNGKSSELYAKEHIESMIFTCFNLNISTFRMWYTLRSVSGLYGGNSW